MRGLENDTEKTIQNFNESVQALFQEQSLLDMHIYTAELQVCVALCVHCGKWDLSNRRCNGRLQSGLPRLTLSAIPMQAIRQAATLEEAEHNHSQNVEVGQEVERLRKLVTKRAGVMTELQKLVFRQRGAVDHLASEDKLIDKTWKKEFLIPELEEHHDMFAKMFKACAPSACFVSICRELSPDFRGQPNFDCFGNPQDRRRGLDAEDAGAVKRGHNLSKSSRNLNSTLNKSPSIKTPSFKALSTPKTPAIKTDSKDGVHHEEESAVPENLDPFDGNLHWEKERDGISLAYLNKVRLAVTGVVTLGLGFRVWGFRVFGFFWRRFLVLVPGRLALRH